MANVSGFEKRSDRAKEDLDDYMALAAVLSPAELRLVTAFRTLRANSSLKVAKNQDGRMVQIIVTHEERVKLAGDVDKPEEGV